MTDKNKKQKRIVVYVPEEDYTALRIKLISVGKTVSGWVREIIEQLLKQ